MIPLEPAIALAASPREWAPALQRHLADHGGARLRATVLHPDDALAEDAQVFVLDDTTSFLTGPLVAELQRRGRVVLGVFDPAEPAGAEHLRGCGVDEVIERNVSPAELLAAIVRLAPAPTPTGTRNGVVDALPSEAASGSEGERLPTPPRERGLARRVAVTGAAGGVGATEIAVALAASGPIDGHPIALVDGVGGHALACRLGLGLYPNLLAVADALARGRTVEPHGWLQPVAEGRLAALVGSGSHAEELRSEDLRQVLTALAAHGPVVLDAGAGPPGTAGGVAAGALGGAMLAPEPHGPTGSASALAGALADVVVLVADATPVGLGHALTWLAAAHGELDPGRLHVILNHSPDDRRARVHLHDEIVRLTPLAGLWHVPVDPRVRRAAWEGAIVDRGPLASVARELAASLLATDGAAPSGSARRSGRRRGARARGGRRR